jgi:hypothetical protein
LKKIALTAAVVISLAATALAQTGGGTMGEGKSGGMQHEGVGSQQMNGGQMMART